LEIVQYLLGSSLFPYLLSQRGRCRNLNTDAGNVILDCLALWLFVLGSESPVKRLVIITDDFMGFLSHSRHIAKMVSEIKP
jgi:hypothetical protein